MSADNQHPEGKLIAGHVEERKGYLYWVLNVVVDGKRKPKWIPTHMKAKGNKTKAKDMLLDVRREWTLKLQAEARQKMEDEGGQEALEGNSTKTVGKAPLLFADFLEIWLSHKYKQATGQTLGKKSNELVTYASYSNMVRFPIEPYFRDHPIALEALTKKDITAFYELQMERVQASTVKHYHSVIHGALEYAIEKELLEHNPADKINFPHKSGFQGDYYSIEEVQLLFDAIKNKKLEVPTVLAAFYGLRRSEVTGLKWSAFNFTKDVFTIRHTVTVFTLDGKKKMIAKDKAKSQTSRRSLPLVHFLKRWLLEKKKEQEQNRILCGRSYNQKFIDYVCVDQMGDMIRPDYITAAFPEFLEKNGLRRIRFHDLRHTCAALLAANGARIEDIKDWLGHSDIKITAEFYMHLEFRAKMSSAQSLEQLYNPPAEASTMTAMEEEIYMLRRQVKILREELGNTVFQQEALPPEELYLPFGK